MLSQQYMLKFSACYEFVPGLYEFLTNTPGLIVIMDSSTTGLIDRRAQ